MNLASRMRRGVGAALGAGVLALALTACGGTDATPTDALQTGVVAIADAAAAGDTTSALAEVDALQQQLTEALDDGTITADMAARIQAALDLVRADLTALIPVPDVSETPLVEEPAGEDPVVTDSPDDEKVRNNNGNDGNSGKDKGKSNNGKGNGD